MSVFLGRTSTWSLNPTMNAGGNEETDQEADLPGRYTRVFASPDVLFRGLRTRPEWLGAMLLGGCLVLAGTLLIPPELTLATLRERMQEQGRAFPPGMADRMQTIRFGGAAAAFVAWFVVLNIFAGVVMVFFAFLLGHEGN